MKATLLIGAALSLLAIPAFGADLGTEALFKAPAVPPPFTWTGCYGGAHVGGGWASKSLTDPVQLVQDSFSGAPVTTGVTTANVSPAGFVGGAQIGCDYQVAPTWVVGIEGAASGSTLKGSTTVGLPLGLPGEAASVSGAMDLLPSVTARFGYAADRWLFYVKGGAALASDSYSVTGSFTGTPFDFEGLDLRYGWTVGGGVEWASKSLTDPVQLVQDSFSGSPVTTGVTTANVSPAGFVGGAQIGCDYQFAPTWVVGIEGAASGSTLKGSTTVGLPLGLPGEAASVSGVMDLLPSVTARFGYAADRWLFYVKGGAALASDSYSVTGTFTGTPFDFEGLDLRYGWTVGGGVEWAFTDIWSARLEYDFFQFGNGSVQMSDATNVLSGPVAVRQSVQVVKAGLNFHVWWGQ